MLDLRQKTLKGETVKARLKAAATPTASFVGSFDPNAIAFPAMHSPPPSPSRKNGKPKKQQQNQKSSTRAPRRRKNSNANKQQQPPASPATPKKVQPKQQLAAAALPPPPKLEEESHFPALATPSVAVDNIVDKVGVEKVASVTKTSADGASTATTASSATSSTSTPVPPAGGYAAALLKAAPPKTETAKTGVNGTATKVSNDSVLWDFVYERT